MGDPETLEFPVSCPRLHKYKLAKILDFAIASGFKLCQMRGIVGNELLEGDFTLRIPDMGKYAIRRYTIIRELFELKSLTINQSHFIDKLGWLSRDTIAHASLGVQMHSVMCKICRL